MSYNSNPHITIFSIFSIAFHFVPQFVHATLLNQDILDAAPCIKDFFKENFIHEMFLQKDEDLYDGEYFGMFCSHVNPFSPHKQLEFSNLSMVKEDNEGNQIKNCLASKQKEYVFETYRHQWLSEVTRQPGHLPKTTLMKFLIGICSAEKYTEFNKLRKKSEKEQTEKCILKCADNFLNRIKRKFITLKTYLIEFLQSKIDWIDSVSFKEIFKESIQCLERNEYITDEHQTFEQAMREKSVTDIKTQIDEGLKYLFAYAEYYNEKESCLPEVMEVQVRVLDKLDMELHRIFKTYGDCCKFECAMGPASTPFYDLIETESAKRDGKPFFIVLTTSNRLQP